MNTREILVPVNLDKHAFEGLEFAAHMSGTTPIHTTLLYVVEANVVALDSRIYNELSQEYHERLRVLSETFFENHPRLRVRIGMPYKEILAEARETNPELIVMAAPKNTGWKWPLHMGTVDRVVKNAPCPTVVLTESGKTLHKNAPNYYSQILAAVANRQETLMHS